jgi:hypothetical protein
VSNVEGVHGQVEAYLPDVATLTTSGSRSGNRPEVWRWYDPARDADITLRVDPDSGEPLSMSRVTRGTGITVAITYTGWNTPVTINPPVN